VLCQFALLIPATLRAQHPEGTEPHPVRAAEFILKTFDQYPMVGITDLPGCEELHNLIRSLIREPAFAGKVQDIIVDFGNPLLQPVVDRYLMDGEMTPRTLLRHVWDDTTRSVDLTWDSPVYEQFFDAVRSANSGLPRDKRLRVVLADSPVDWTSLKHPANLYPFLDSRSQVLASKVNASILAGRTPLSSPSQSICFAADEVETPGKSLTAQIQANSSQSSRRDVSASGMGIARLKMPNCRGIQTPSLLPRIHG
jgi:hypothetical protein